MDAVALRLTGGTRVYQRGATRHVVFADLDLEVRTGEILALLGPSGCGKSTLLRVLAGLEPADRGGLHVGDGGRGPRAVGVAFQDPSLLPWLTVAENVALGLRFTANREARVPGSIARTLSELGLESLADSYPAELSGGQAQRVNVARLVVAGRPILLLDEPFAALDPATREALQDWLRELQRLRNLTMVVVTHDVSEAIHLGDRIALMAGTPGSIRRIWDVRGIGGRADEAATTDLLRREIRAQYHIDLPTSEARRLDARLPLPTS
jgi:ABC-type nitrate/sulfonate/bicarbonate transport system ATPase subunit